MDAIVKPEFTSTQAQLVVDVLNDAIIREKKKDQEYALDIQKVRDIILTAARKK